VPILVFKRIPSDPEQERESVPVKRERPPPWRWLDHGGGQLDLLLAEEPGEVQKRKFADLQVRGYLLTRSLLPLS